MSQLEQIPIMVAPMNDALTGNADALLAEIATLLERWLDTGVPGSIDLRGLPLSPRDHAYLREQLGAGEVRAEVQALGVSEARETSFPGVWWVTHRNADQEVMAELIEINAVPDILNSQTDDARAGLTRLRAQLQTAPTQSDLL